MIDARTHHDPALAPGLIATAIEKTGTQKELAARLGMTPRYLQMLKQGKHRMNYPLQVTLEMIAADKSPYDEKSD